MPKGYLFLVLHAHLPYVRHPEYDRFLEERWFFEAVTETYVPLVKFFDRLKAEGSPFRLTLSVSPTLAAMMEDPLLRERCVRHLDLSIRLAELECERTRHWPDVHFLAQMYRRLFAEARQTFVERCGTRLATAFREHAADGSLELITCAGTHGYLPLLSSEPSAVRAQVFAAVREHERIFGSPPKGMWVPECAYYPGLDDLLAEAGVRYFFVDGHAVEHADPRPLFGVSAPVYCPSGVAAFGRHPMTSKLVWSTNVGYPADYNYREYYRDIGFDLDQDYLAPFQYAAGVRTGTGIKYHRITGPGPDKHLYNPDWARETAQRHAHDFAARCRDQAARAGAGMPFPGVIVSPYDAELFGHWWFEGPQWLYHVLREVSGGGDLELGTPGRYLDAHPVQQLGPQRLPRALGQPRDRLDVAPAARGGGPDAAGGAGPPGGAAGQPRGPPAAPGRPRAAAGAVLGLAVHHHQRHRRGVRPPPLPRPRQPLPLPAARPGGAAGRPGPARGLRVHGRAVPGPGLPPVRRGGRPGGVTEALLIARRQLFTLPAEVTPVKCWFCEQEARGTCAACGRGLCRDHANIHDEMTLAKSDTSTGYASYYNVYGALKCSACRLEWQSFTPRP
jgi:1,4-alpha-glucan branching enzyme